MTNRSIAVNYLRFWYEAAGISTPFPEVVKTLEHGTFLDQLGRTVKGIRQDKVRVAFHALAKRRGKVIPKPAEFFDALVVEVQHFDFQDAKDVAVQTVQDVGKVAAIGAGTYLAVLAIGALIILGPSLRRALA